MDLNDFLSGGSEYIATNRPKHPDMDRLMEISLGMQAITQEAATYEEHAAVWRNHIDSIIDYDAIAWHAINVGFSVFGVETAEDLFTLRQDHARNMQFIQTIQAFYDGFLVGAEFERRGGHREK